MAGLLKRNTTVLSISAPSWLNLRTDAAQTPVSMLKNGQYFAFASKPGSV